MKILGFETSCDECSAAVVENGRRILSHVVASQVEQHAPWNGVVPEIASRLHVEWIELVTAKALAEAKLTIDDVDGIAVTVKPGLVGSLLVGLSYAKALAWTSGKPWVGIDHIEAHLYAPHLEQTVVYPCLGLIVSGGHTILCRLEKPGQIEVLGTTIDDACGEAFDKVAKHYQMGYPGGVVLDSLAEKGDPLSFRFPQPRLHKGSHRYDVSYSGLKTACINQRERFHVSGPLDSLPNIAASFRKAAVDMLVDRVKKAVRDTGIRHLVAGGGVSANRLLRRTLQEDQSLHTCFPSLSLCTDNGAMVAGLAYEKLNAGERSPWTLNVNARVLNFRRGYP